MSLLNLDGVIFNERKYLMKLILSIEDKTEIKRFLLVLNVGLINSLKNGLISIEEVENYLYNPYSLERLRNLGVDQEIIELIQEGCELKNIDRIIKNQLKQTMDELESKSINNLKKLPKSFIPVKKWID
jgi:hypothetical protein